MANDFNDFKTQFLRMWATFSPYEAFRSGLREYAGLIDIFTPAKIENFRYSLKNFQTKLSQVDYESLSTSDKVEFLLFSNKLSLELFELDDLDIYHSNPMSYAGVASIFEYLIKNYAPLDQRVQELALHLAHFPGYFKQAQDNLDTTKMAPEIVEIAHIITTGNISFLSNLEAELRDLSQSTGELISDQTLQTVLEHNKLALKALEDYDSYLQAVLPNAKASFRLGKDLYLKMLSAEERVENVTIEKLLEVCENNLQRNLAEFEAAAKNVDPAKTPAEIMASVRKNHPTKESLLADTQKVLDMTKEYCRNMVGMPSEIMPHVIYTPKPMREWAMAAMNSPGALETIATDSYYYVTPPNENWSEQEQNEWLEVFNYKGLIDITVHECFPGHYLHHLHNQRSPYIFSKLFGAYHFWEGYALHVEEEMWQIGFQQGDYEYRMAQLTETLLRNVRMIVSIKLHTTTDFTVEDGTQLFMKYAYLGRKPAETEAKRGTFDPGYLNYCLGKLMIEKLKEDYKKEKGSAFDNKEFYNKLLDFGAPPIPIVRKFMLENKVIHEEIL